MLYTRHYQIAARAEQNRARSAQKPTARTANRGPHNKGSSCLDAPPHGRSEKVTRTDGHEADDESEPSPSDSEALKDGYNEVVEKEAIEDLKRGATFGSLAIENRRAFAVSDMFNLGSPLLQDLLGDVPVAQAQAQPSASGSGDQAAGGIAEQVRALPPSKAAWGVWKRPSP